MKRVLLALLAIGVITLIACGNEGDGELTPLPMGKRGKLRDTTNFTRILWLDSTINFGTVNAGEVVNIKFRFRNVGQKALHVEEVKASCGCTTGDYTKEPVQPGQEGWVSAVFNSDGFNGTVHKSLRVKTNTTNSYISNVFFTGEVLGKEPGEPVKVSH